MSDVYFVIEKDHEGCDRLAVRYPDGEEPRLTNEQAAILASIETAKALRMIEASISNLYDHFGDMAGNLDGLRQIASLMEINGRMPEKL